MASKNGFILHKNKTQDSETVDKGFDPRTLVDTVLKINMKMLNK